MQTFNASVERASRDVRSSVLDSDEIVSGRQRRVAELVAFLDLATDQLHPGRTADVDGQRTAAGPRRVDDELTQLTYTRTRNNITEPCSRLSTVRG